jgi:hypothetical protein
MNKLDNIIAWQSLASFYSASKKATRGGDSWDAKSLERGYVDGRQAQFECTKNLSKGYDELKAQADKLAEALRWECCCPGETNWTTGKPILCDACEVLAKYSLK